MTSSGSRKRPRTIVFDDPWSVLHFVLGFMTRLLKDLGLWIVSLAIFVAFVAYEVVEQESRFCKLGDFVEYLIGYTMADLALGDLR